MSEVRYTARIVGHEPPFKWTVERHGPDDASKCSPADCRGEEDSYELALVEAHAAARRAEWKRQHDTTVENEELFTVVDVQHRPAASIASDFHPFTD